MDQLLAHWFGDYILQSDWMAMKKHQNSWRCFVHVALYTLPFLLLTRSVPALAFIFATHFLIDRFSLAKYLIWAKNHLNPGFCYFPWKDCNLTGYFDCDDRADHPDRRPKFITVWLYIITDNGLHLACNAFALAWLA